jgi:hypothetical protein
MIQKITLVINQLKNIENNSGKLELTCQTHNPNHELMII